MLRNRSVLAATAAVLVALVVIAVLALAPSSEDSSAGVLIQGDANCDQAVDARDALADLKEVAAIEPPAACVFLAGDVDCSGSIEASDVTGILLFHANATQPSTGAGCPPIGEPVTSPTGTASPSPGSPTPTAGSPTVTPTANATPGTSYIAQPVLPSAYLGDAASTVVEFRVIPGLPNEAIVALQSGYIYRVALDQSFAPQVWGNLTNEVAYTAGSEQGLLSVAFSPNYETDHRVYAYYTHQKPGPERLSRFDSTPEGGLGAMEALLDIPHPDHLNHNGGHIVFGNDGYLYLSVGDGGGGGDPDNNAQKLTTLLGKIIRIDVSGPTGYTVPEDNPFTGTPCTTPRTPGDTTACSEIFAYGLRNPFRFMSDPVSGDIWVGDVGQNVWEEVDKLASGGNYGWDCYEGFEVYASNNDPVCDNPPNFIAPRAAYDHDFGQAVTGGTIYRGSDLPELSGLYVYADFYSGRVWVVNPNDNSDPVQIADVPFNISSFTLATNGELYLVSYSDGIFQLAK